MNGKTYKGESHTISLLIKISDFFKCTFDDFFIIIIQELGSAAMKILRRRLNIANFLVMIRDLLK